MAEERIDPEIGLQEQILVIYNVSKKHNITDLVISGYAHGFSIALVGCKKYADEHVPASVRGHAIIRRYDTIEECKQELDARKIPLWGIEIIEGAVNVETDPFQQKFALMPGNEGTGLSDKQKSLCDGFIYISQYGAGTASLNVNVATNIVLNRYYTWSKQPQVR